MEDFFLRLQYSPKVIVHLVEKTAMQMHGVGAPLNQRQVHSDNEKRHGGGRRGHAQPTVDREAWDDVIAALGEGDPADTQTLERAARKIRCHRTTLLRIRENPQQGIRQSVIHDVIKAAERVSPELKSRAEAITLSPDEQRLLRQYFDWIDAQLRAHRENFNHMVLWNAIMRRFNRPGGVLRPFIEWMCKKGFRESRQELALWRIIQPLLANGDTLSIEAGWRALGFEDEERIPMSHELPEKDHLEQFLRRAIANEKALLGLMRSDVTRARMAVARHQTLEINAPVSMDGPPVIAVWAASPGS